MNDLDLLYLLEKELNIHFDEVNWESLNRIYVTLENELNNKKTIIAQYCLSFDLRIIGLTLHHVPIKNIDYLSNFKHLFPFHHIAQRNVHS